jgi:hypothetical protein
LNPTAGVGFGADFVRTLARRGLTLALGLRAKVMEIDPDIARFVAAIGATGPFSNDAISALLRDLFKRPNYFVLGGRLLIIKISRSQKPFWGVGKEVIDLLEGLSNYNLVLLVPGNEGWVFSKAEVHSRISNHTWKPGADNDYKINPPLPDANTFAGPKTFRKKLGLGEP